MTQRRVLVTGGSGFMGSHLVHRLLAAGADLAVVVRYNNVMKNERLREVWDRLRIIEADLRNRGALAAIPQFAPEIVFHLAAYNHVGESFRQVEECFDVNAKGTANLLDTCNDVERFVYVSTSEVYGAQTSVPFVETMCPQPLSPYAITKYAGEIYCRMKQQIGVRERIAVVRPFNVFGQYQSTKAIIPELILNALQGHPIRATKGVQTREFNYVGNVIDGLIMAAQHPEPIEEVLNLCSGEEVAIADLVHKVVELTASPSQVEIGALPYRPTEIWRMYGDSSRAREVLGWHPRIGLEEGLRQTIDWYRQYLRGSGKAIP